MHNQVLSSLVRFLTGDPLFFNQSIPVVNFPEESLPSPYLYIHLERFVDGRRTDVPENEHYVVTDFFLSLRCNAMGQSRSLDVLQYCKTQLQGRWINLEGEENPRRALVLKVMDHQLEPTALFKLTIKMRAEVVFHPSV
ncbi:MAG: hypothetical protein K2X53_02670 [Alphaproteobacteria bacterium]|nr:hypothetical protein [Alphaproteobacteria bacterium]